MGNAPKIKRRQLPLVIFQGDWPILLDEMAQKVDQARTEATPARRVATGKSEAMKLAEQLDEMVAEAEKTGIRLLVQALPRSQWRDLKAKHPPRKDDTEDEVFGVNQETLWKDAAPFGPGKDQEPCVVDPEFTETEWAEFADDLSDADYTRLCQVIWEVNERSTSIPKYSAVSLLQRQNENDSKLLPPGESPPADSTGGNPKKFTRQSTTKTAG